jgi:hypothetical protein
MAPRDELALIERDQTADQARLDRYASGATDAGFGILPQWQDEPYLQGWIDTIRQLPLNPDGTIKHYQKQAFFESRSVVDWGAAVDRRGYDEF